MDPIRVLQLPTAAPEPEHLLAELVAGIDLVAEGVASRVIVANVGGIDAVAAAALAHAQSRGVAFRVDRRQDDEPAAVIGPRQR